jgi:hypothetical protein
MDNIQNCDSYINIPSPQTYRSHFHKYLKLTIIFGELVDISKVLL